MQTRRVGVAALILVAAVFGSGCAHQLEVKNLRSYHNMQMNPLNKPVTIGVIPSTEDIDSQRLMKGVGNALAKYSATILMPYSPGSSRKADVVANIAIRPEYEGSGWNFLVNFPGFLVWAPAWNGYVYHVNYNVQIMLTNAADGSKIDSWAIPINLNLRHAAMDRTWTEISWFEVGVIALVGGIVFIQYDDDVTPLLVEKIEVPIGDYIGQEIVNRINNSAGVSDARPIIQHTDVAAAVAPSR